VHYRKDSDNNVSVEDSKPCAKPVVNASDVSVIHLKPSQKPVPDDKLHPNHPKSGLLLDEWCFVLSPTNINRFSIHTIDKSIVNEFLDNVKLIPESKYGFVRDTRIKALCTWERLMVFVENMVLFGISF
jgi:hypothetical protein